MTTGKSKGLSKDYLDKKYARRNALIPFTTLLGFWVAGLVSGSAILEAVFNRQGLGSVAAGAARVTDHNTVQAFTMIYAVALVLVNLGIDIAYGYIRAVEPYLSVLTAQGRATVFISRDPRDMIVSHVFYATHMHKGHGMHRYYNQELTSMEERINAAITGVQVPGAELPSLKTRYDGYLGWLDQDQVLCIRFEDLIEEREKTFALLLDYLVQRGLRLETPRPDAIAILNRAIVPRKSGTFRKGKTGSWREHFTENNKDVFKENSGDLLMRMGYETGKDW